MITLSSEFSNRAGLKDTKKVVVAHLHYDVSGDNYLRVANVPLVISDNQYLPILKNVVGSSQNWNIDSDNLVTISIPTLTLKNYEPIGFSILEEFSTRTYRGFKVEVWVGYEGLSIDQMLPIFNGTIDNLELSMDTVIIKTKSLSLDKTNINGRRVSYTDNSIGTDELTGTKHVVKEADGKYLPISFGKNWCAPALNYAEDTTDSYRYFGYGDYEDISGAEAPPTSAIANYQTNLGREENIIYLVDDGKLVPQGEQGFGATANTAFARDYDNSPAPDEIILYDDYHFRSDNGLLVNVPLKILVAEADEAVTKTDVTDHNSSESALTACFLGDYSETPFYSTIKGSGFPSAELEMFVNATLNLDRNLKCWTGGSIYPSRPISMLSNTTLLLLGRWIWEGNTGADPQWPILFYCWKNSFYPAIGSPGSADTGENNYIGSTEFGFETGQYESYNENCRCYGTNITSPYVDGDAILPAIGWVDWTETVGTDIVDAGSGDDITVGMGSAPELKRETLEGGVGTRVEFKFTQVDDSENLDVKLSQFYGTMTNDLSISPGGYLYLPTNGLTLVNGTSLNSTPTGADYQLKYPFQYLEQILVNAGLTTDTGFDLTTAWGAFFGTTRDDSGFSIVDETNLKDFVSEYCKYEPFVLVPSVEGEYTLPMLKKEYVIGDCVGTVDYADLTAMTVSKTPSSALCAEIVACKTDYVHGLNDYSLNINWVLDDTDYDYDYNLGGNSLANNSLKLDSLEKQYTSCPNISNVSHDSKYWSCVRSNTNSEPSATNLDWIEMADNSHIGLDAWSDSTAYLGEDAENRGIAEWWLNMWANQHNIISLKTNDLSYAKYAIGDIIKFTGVPFKLFGNNYEGFNGSGTWSNEINGQAVYGAFVVTKISKSMNEVSMEVLQLHDLTAYSIKRREA